MKREEAVKLGMAPLCHSRSSAMDSFSSLNNTTSSAASVPSFLTPTAPMLNSTNPGNDINVQNNITKAVIKGLAIVEIISGLIALVLGTTCFTLSFTHVTYIPALMITTEGICYDATGIWVGVLYLITGAIGLGALKGAKERRCLLTSYFILSIISAIASVLLFTSSLVNAVLPHISFSYLHGLNIGIAFISGVLFLAFIVSTSILCRNYHYCNCCCCCTTRP